MHITFVKEVARPGKPCNKCAQVEQDLRENGHWDSIDSVLVTDERIEDSAGVRVATALGISQAPFFVVKDDDGGVRLYTIYLKFVAEVLAQQDDRIPVDAAA
jgi:hypothetical protein